MHTGPILRGAWLSGAALCFLPLAAAQDADKQFARLCAACHGDRATGTDRGPALVNSRSLRHRSEKQILDIIRNGAPGGMPPFSLPADQLQSLAGWVRSLNTSAYDLKPPGDAAHGEQFFFGKGQCGSCHRVTGRGKSNGPDLSDIGRQLTLREIEQSLDDPTSRLGTHSSSSCPGWAWCPQDPWSIVNVRMATARCSADSRAAKASTICSCRPWTAISIFCSTPSTNR